jgi:hypothetical protein
MKLLRPKSSKTVEQFLEHRREIRKEPSIEESVRLWMRLHPGEELAPDGLPYSLGPIVRKRTA